MILTFRTVARQTAAAHDLSCCERLPWPELCDIRPELGFWDVPLVVDRSLMTEESRDECVRAW